MSVLNLIQKDCWNLLKLALNHPLLEQLDEIDEDGNTPLHLTCLKGQPKFTELLISQGCDIHAANYMGQTALHIAIENNELECVRVLIHHGANVNQLDKNGWPPIFTATKNGNVQMVQYLHTKNADINYSNRDGNVLHLAAKYNQKPLIVYFITKQINLNQRNSFGQTPLSMAISSRNSEIAIVLLGYNAETIPPYPGRIPKTLLHMTIEYGDEQVAKLLLKSHDVDARDGENRTPLHLAAEGNHFVIGQYLLKKNADPNVQDNDGYTPLHIAVAKGHIDFLNVLISYDYSKHIRKDGTTPMKLNHEITTKHGDNVLHLLAMSDIRNDIKMDTFFKLMHMKVSKLVCKTNKDFRTPLHYANEHFCRPLITAFINLNADVDEVDRFGKKPKNYCSNPEGFKSQGFKFSSFNRRRNLRRDST